MGMTADDVYAILNRKIKNSSGGGGGGTGTDNYNDLRNKPRINGVELTGNVSLEDLGITGVGIPVGNCSGIETLKGDKKVLIKWQDPDDTRTGEIVLAKWTGTRLVRKEGSYPEDQNDGTLVVDSTVRDQYKSTWYTDSGLEDGVTYYYKLFPHAGLTYTNDEANQFTETPQEIPLKDVTQAQAKAGNATVYLTWKDPADIAQSSSNAGATWAGTKVVRKTGSEPTGPDDGTEVVNEKTRDQYSTSEYADSGLLNDTTYYYAIYPYTVDGTYSTGVQVSAMPYIENPSPCTGISARDGDKKVAITWTDPPETEKKENQTVTWAGTKLVRKLESAPESYDDGELLKTSTTHDEHKSSGYVDEGLENGTEYFYAVFAYSTDGKYSEGISTSATPKEMTYDPELANNSWEQIAAAAESGEAKTTWNTGDTITITLDGNYAQELTVEIADFDHDEKTDGSGKAGITFVCKYIMKGNKHMNASSTNEGGYAASEMHTTILEEVFTCLPAELQSAIKQVKKPTGTGGGSSSGTEDVDCKLFLLSEIEVGLHSYSVEGEGETYPIFTDANSRKKYYEGQSDIAHAWWLRSPRSGLSTYFCVVNASGNASSNVASYSFGVAFGFSI